MEKTTQTPSSISPSSVTPSTVILNNKCWVTINTKIIRLLEQEDWCTYKPPIEGSPMYIQNGRIQVTRRLLPCLSASIKRKSIPVIIDPAIKISFICNDLFNIYVQSSYTDEEIQFRKHERQKQTAYCWWSQKRALVTRARIWLPLTWNTTQGGVEDVVRLNLIEPNPGLVNGFVVLGRDFYAKHLPSFSLRKNVVMFNLASKRNASVAMEMRWSTVTDHIPIVDQQKGAVYLIDKYQKNCEYRKKNCNRREDYAGDLCSCNHFATMYALPQIYWY